MAYRYLKNIWANLRQLADRNIWDIADNGVPVNGVSGTGIDFAGPGSIYANLDNGDLYVNTGTILSPIWTRLADTSDLVVLPINLATQVTGDLPLSNIVPSAAASRLLGRGSASAGDWEPITLGANLSLTGTVLAAAAGSAQFTLAPVTVQAGDGALDPNTDATYVITKTSAAALTLAAPTNPGSNGKTIVITSDTAFAHTITTATLLDTGTALTTSVVFAAFRGASVTLMAYNGRYKIISGNAFTLT